MRALLSETVGSRPLSLKTCRRAPTDILHLTPSLHTHAPLHTHLQAHTHKDVCVCVCVYFHKTDDCVLTTNLQQQLCILISFKIARENRSAMLA